MEEIIRVVDLEKTFGPIVAVDKINFEVYEGECFGLLGPNGAGKSSTIKMLTASSPINSGQAIIDGLNVAETPRDVKRILGVVQQDDNLDPDLTVSGNLVAYGRYFRIPKEEVKVRAKEILRFFGLSDRSGDRIETLSGGMQRRLVIARATLNRPRLLILDEPTTGLDPIARQQVWYWLQELLRQGVSILLSTHNMDEANVLCDRLLVMDHGKILAKGDPRELVATHLANQVVEIRPSLSQIDQVHSDLKRRDVLVRTSGTVVLAFAPDGKALEEQLTQEGLDATVRPANLEDVFFHLTGRSLEEGVG